VTETILVTGAAGSIGTMLRARLNRPGRTLRLLDIEPMVADDGEEVVPASMHDAGALVGACTGADAVVHLAGMAGNGEWAVILERNIEGTYEVLEAARTAGVPRVVLASSNHAVGFFPRSKAPAPDDLPPRPDTYYGVSKAFGEALGSMYHDRFGLDVVCLRILSCRARPQSPRELSTWLSPDDCGRLFDAALTAPSPGFRIVWGVSANTRGWFSLDGARALGYEPHDDAEAYLAEIGEPDPDDPEGRHVGGPWAVAD
jgi:hypothetical protein